MVQPMEGNHQLYDSKKKRCPEGDGSFTPAKEHSWMDKPPRFDGISQAKNEDFSSHVFPAMLVYRRFMHPYIHTLTYDIPNIHISSQSYLLQGPSFLVSLRYSPENQRMSPENQWLEELLILSEGHSAQPIGTEKWTPYGPRCPCTAPERRHFPWRKFSAEIGPVFCWDMEL